MILQGACTTTVEVLEPSFPAPTCVRDQTEALSVYAIREGPPRWLGETCQALGGLLNLPGDWDSYGAAPVNVRAVEHAHAMIGTLARFVGVPRPAVTATPDGEVGFCWDTGDRSLDVSVDDSGLISYVFLDERDPGNEEEGRTRSPGDLVAFLTRR